MNGFTGKILIEESKIKALIPSENDVIINNEGKISSYRDCSALPGFIDGHGHLTGYGLHLNGLSLDGIKSKEDCLEEVLKFNKLRGGWIFGRGWNHELWDNKILPDKYILDKYFPDVPVCLIRVDGHSAWVNSKALQIAGVDKFTKDPDGGEFLRDKSGNPNGLILDNAINFISKHIPKPDTKEIAEGILTACKDLNSNGITVTHDMDVNHEYIPVFKELSKSGKLTLKIKSFIRGFDGVWERRNLIPEKIGDLEISGLKFFTDGALGSMGAALLQPYKNRQNYTGLLLIRESELQRIADKGIKNGWDIASHAIGDSANRMVSKVYESLRKSNPNYNGNLRIEHAQMIHPDDISRISNNGIIASIQPQHCISDIKMANTRLDKEALNNSYRWKSLIDSGISIIPGSDYPIETPKPLLGIDAFVNRIPDGYKSSWNKNETISLERAVSLYTQNFTMPQNPSKLLKLDDDADITIISQKQISRNNINTLKIKATYFKGKSVYTNI